MKIGQRVMTLEGRLGTVQSVDNVVGEATIKAITGEIFTTEVKKLIILNFLKWLGRKLLALLVG